MFGIDTAPVPPAANAKESEGYRGECGENGHGVRAQLPDSVALSINET
jgi:hypothetical protein